LTVVFTSPLGQTNSVDGFWDGGQTWHVRFSPNQPGRWSYTTFCSDPANRGLLRQHGAFLCTAPTGRNRFTRHGPVRLARDRRHFAHEDGAPFFWIADSAWNGARVSAPQDWDTYARIREAQSFTAVQWAVAPGEDGVQQSAFTLKDKDGIRINPDFFQRLDSKVEALGRAGLLSVIAPFWSLDDVAGNTLQQDQQTLLLRYMVARWGANPVAWVLAFEGDSRLQDAASPAGPGRAVFGEGDHAPVILFVRHAWAATDEFRNDPWIDALGYATGSNPGSPPAKALLETWTRDIGRPVLNVAPPLENGIAPENGRRITADETRHAIWSSLLQSPPAGISYGAEGVVHWDTTVQRAEAATSGMDLPVWQKSLFLPGARQMATLATVFNAIEFWRVRPAPGTLAAQPGQESLNDGAVAAGTVTRDLTLVYVPGNRAVELLIEDLPASPLVAWTDARTGEQASAVGVVKGRLCQFPAPDSGDWLLVLKAGK
jgi:hypothetical protein